MNRILPPPILGALLALMMITNLLFWAVPVYALIFIKLLTWGRGRILLSHWIASTAQQWAAVNVWMWENLLGIEWDMRGVESLDRNGQYMAISNHQTWNDIPVVMKAFDRRAPFFKFFMKQELIWVPVLGLAWWGLDFPFMKRHTPEQIAQNPELRNQDIETTRTACQKFQHIPVLILNYLEGTRFTQEKHERQESPYKHLLKPKIGGFAFALSVMGERLQHLLDITVVYPDGAMKFWDFACGRVRRVIVEVRQLEIPSDFFHGDYAEDAEFRERIKLWADNLWRQKDRRIDELLTEAQRTAAT